MQDNYQPKTIGDVLARDGGAILGKPDAVCPHCGKGPKVREVTTPKKQYKLIFYLPCACRGARDS